MATLQNLKDEMLGQKERLGDELVAKADAKMQLVRQFRDEVCLDVDTI